MRTSLKLFILITLLNFSSHCFSQSKIEQSKAEINNGTGSSGSQTPAQSTAPARPRHSGGRDRDGFCFEGKSIGEIIGGVLAEVVLFVTFYSTIGDYEHEAHLSNRLTKYPYYNKISGNYQVPDSVNTAESQFRFDVDYQFLYSGKNLTGHHFNLNIRPLQYFYLQAQYRELRETNFDSASSHLSLYHFNFCYDRLRFERFNFGWQMGVAYVANNVNKSGFSYGVNAEAFIFNPVSISVSSQWSKINHVAVNTFDVVGKFHSNRYNFQLGYERLKIGTPIYKYMSLGVGVKF